MSNVKRSFRKRHQWHAWSGEMADLERLGKIVEELNLARLRELESEKQQQEGAIHVADAINIVGTRNIVQVFPTDAGLYPFVGLIVEDEDEVAGPVSEVLPEVDRRSVASLKFVAALWPSERLSVTFLRSTGEAVVIDVVSQRTGWAKQAYARLADEIEKGVPRWAPLRSETSRLLLSFFASAAFGGFFGLVFAKLTPWDIYWIVGPLAALVALPLVSAQRLHNWIFPGFELQGEGGQSSGTRRLVALSLLGASIPIGILVNAVS
jgi:hypothetical protein